MSDPFDDLSCHGVSVWLDDLSQDSWPAACCSA
jgi:hypothetical protein